MKDEIPLSESELPPPEHFAETQAARICSLTTLALVLILSAFQIHHLLLVVPRFEWMFAEMGLSLPVITQFLLTARSSVVGLVGLLALASVAKEAAVEDRRATLVVNCVHLVLLVAMGKLARLALELPMLRLFEEIGGT